MEVSANADAKENAVRGHGHGRARFDAAAVAEVGVSASAFGGRWVCRIARL